MKQLTCIIVDDEPLAQRMLENFVERTPFLCHVASYGDPFLALNALREQPVNVVFLDIQMPDLDGMELSRMIPAETRIIFTTAFKEFAFESYEVNALDFLLKPIRYQKFLAAAEKARQWFSLTEEKDEAPAERLFVRVDGELRQIDLRQIVYVQGMKDYVMFYLQGERRPLVTHITMKAVEDMLPADRFMRVHRSYIIALDKIRSIDRNLCVYIGEAIIHVTDAYRDAFNEFVNKLSLIN